jgi:hypothetical protein
MLFHDLVNNRPPTQSSFGSKCSEAATTKEKHRQEGGASISLAWGPSHVPVVVLPQACTHEKLRLSSVLLQNIRIRALSVQQDLRNQNKNKKEREVIPS